MSGILGLWNTGGRPVDRAILSKMGATMAHRGPDGEGQWVQGEFGLACQQLRVTAESLEETQPYVSNAGVGVVLDGRLDNRSELLDEIGRKANFSSASPDVEFVAAAYQVFGEDFPKRLNGDFALGVLDSRQRKLILARDGMGIRPLYYCRVKESVLFASEIKALLAHPEMEAEPDDDVLAAYLMFRLGARFQDRRGLTLFKDVLTVLPASMVVVTPPGMVSRQYWDFDASRKTRFRSFEDYVEGYRHYFGQAVRRRVRSTHPVGILVSGGLDSSSIICQAEAWKKQGTNHLPELIGYSYTPMDGSPGDESAYIETIERDYGIRIERIGLGGYEDLARNCREVARHVEVPFLEMEWNTYHSLRAAAQKRGVRSLIGGQWADQMLWNQGYLVDFFYHLRWGEIAKHLRGYHRWQTDGDATFYRKRFLHDLLIYSLPDSLAPLLRKFRSRFVGYHLDRSWFPREFRQRARQYDSGRSPVAFGKFGSAHARSLYHVAKSRYYGMQLDTENKLNSMYGMETAFPYLDRDLIQYLMEIPGEMVAFGGVPKGILRKGMAGVLPKEIEKRNWKGDWTDRENEAMSKLYPELVDYLASHRQAFARQYLDREALMLEFAKVKDEILGSDCSVTWRIADVLALGQWLDVFFPSLDRQAALLSAERSDKQVARSR